MFAFSLFSIGTSYKGKEVERFWVVAVMSAHDREKADGCPLLAMARRERREKC